ncbi:MAG: class I SAM-dependent methyltransferase [Acidimicrobiales bacterium]
MVTTPTPMPAPTVDRSTGLRFGEAVALYDRFRPSYPRDVIEAVVADAGAGPVLEVGAGTGKATKALLALGHPVHAIEPDGRMAGALTLNCPSDAVTVVPTTFEQAGLTAGGYRLVVAAQSWEWVDPSVAYERAAMALGPGGHLALVWHQPAPGQGLFGEAIRHIYRRVEPHLARTILPGSATVSFRPGRVAAATAAFPTWTRVEHEWSRDIDAAGLVGWLCSEVRYLVLDPERRTRLMVAVARLVDEFGGIVSVPMTTVAHIGRRPD